MYKRATTAFAIMVMIETAIRLIIIYTLNIDELAMIYIYVVRCICPIISLIFYHLDYKKHGYVDRKLNRYDWIAFFALIFYCIAAFGMENDPIQPYFLFMVFPTMIFYIYIQCKNPGLL